MNIRPAQQADLPAIARIYNQGIEDRLATFETQPRLPSDIGPWLARIERYPLLVSVDADQKLQAWANVSAYRERDCYAGIGEFSIYVERSARGQGVGAPLLHALLQSAADRGYWKLLSRIFTFNQPSRRLCSACGFREVGEYQRHARLDGRWLDVVIVERLIPQNQPVQSEV